MHFLYHIHPALGKPFECKRRFVGQKEAVQYKQGTVVSVNEDVQHKCVLSLMQIKMLAFCLKKIGGGGGQYVVVFKQ